MAKFITSLPGVGGATAATLNKHGFRVVEDIANASPEALSAVPGFRASRAAKIIAAARATLAEEQAVKTTEVKKSPRAKPVVHAEASKAEMSEAKPPKVKAPKSPKPPKDEAPVVVDVQEKPAKVAKMIVDEMPKMKTPKAPKAETAAQPAKPEKKTQDSKMIVDEMPKVKTPKAPKVPKAEIATQPLGACRTFPVSGGGAVR
ncbi:MAG: hypothetical protein KBE53_09610 [Chromatiaceae bacterium]|nr:hypothetical protein [Chromatiaceae bacterium]